KPDAWCAGGAGYPSPPMRRSTSATTTTTGTSRAAQSTHTHATGALRDEHRTDSRRADQRRCSAVGHHAPTMRRADQQLFIAHLVSTRASMQVRDLCQPCTTTL